MATINFTPPSGAATVTVVTLMKLLKMSPKRYGESFDVRNVCIAGVVPGSFKEEYIVRLAKLRY